MVWVEVFLIFLGIPAALFVLITVVVFRLTTPRVPDGIARLSQQRAEAEQDTPQQPPMPEERPKSEGE